MNSNYVQFGCGLSAPKGWRNFDSSPTLRFERIPGIGQLYTRNANRFPASVEYGDIVRGLPVTKSQCQGVYCSHVLEHLCLEDFRKAIQNTHQILTEGGIFRFVLPDLEYAVRQYNDADSPDAAFGFMKNTILGKETRARGFRAFLSDYFGNYQHLWMWDFASISQELRTIGFTDIRRAHFGDSEDTVFSHAEDESRWTDALGVECRKAEVVLDQRAA